MAHHRINEIESRLAALDVRIETVESRLSVLEFCVGTGPDLRSLDTEIAQIRRAKQAARGEQDYPAATSLSGKERRLLDEKGSRRREWAAAHPDPPSLAEQVSQLSEEIEQLRSLLRQQGSDPEEGTG